jgi:hypothetical protein
MDFLGAVYINLTQNLKIECLHFSCETIQRISVTTKAIKIFVHSRQVSGKLLRSILQATKVLINLRSS